MIRTESEYRAALKRLEQDRAFIAEQRRVLGEHGLDAASITRAMAPALSFHEQLKDEVEAYEQIVRGDITPIKDLTDIGRILIGLRIASRVTQRELAERLGVSESAVSRDERNEYQGVTVERAQRILDALNGKICLTAEPAFSEDASVGTVDVALMP